MERLGTLMGCMVIVSVALVAVPRSQAEENTWVNHPDLRFSHVKDLASGEPRPTTVGSSGNRDCTMRTVTVRPSQNYLIFNDPSEIKQIVCGVDTQYGFVSSMFVRAGTSIGGPISFPEHHSQFIAAAPLSDTGILLDPSATTGSFLSYVTNIGAYIETKKKSKGEVEHKLPSTAHIVRPKTHTGGRVAVMPDTMAFSSNGKWMIADVPFYGLLRMNTETGETLFFGAPTVYNNGMLAGYQTAISADGRYVAVASHTFQSFIIYDLGSCSGQSQAHPWLRNCAKRNVQEQLLKDVNFGTSASQIRFTDHNQMTFYTGKVIGGAVKIRQYRLTMGDVPQYGFGYLGLGDSFASGEGAGSYKTITDQDNSNMCHTSTISYPFQIGKELEKERYESVACSGAILNDVFLSEENKYEGQAKDGLRQEDRDLKTIIESFLPGKITQFSFVNELNPEAVTISIGGNDVAFDDKIKSCVLDILPSTSCFDTYEDRVEVVREIKEQVPRLTQTYQNLAQRNRKVYVLGYPKLINPGGNCAVNVRMDGSEADFANKLAALLNEAVETAAKRAGVQYVDVEDLLEGHRFCEADSKDVYVHGITYGDETGPLGSKILSKGSFHPKAEAQPLYRNAVIAQSENLTKPMPKPDPSAEFPVPANGDAFWQVVRSGRKTYVPSRIEATPIIGKGLAKVVQVKDGFRRFNPSSLVNVQLHSQPVDLGNFTADSQGNLTATITVPESVPPGYHSLHFYGENVAGEPIDLYQYLYVYASETDFDGDGILDEDDDCTFIEPINEDVDADGIDDGCDGDIGPPPTPEPTPNPIGLPTDVTGELPEEDKDGLNESVAGNEELIAQPAETVEQASNNVATTINADIPRRVLRVVADAATPGDQNVLGAQATDDSAQGNNPEPKPVIASGLQKPSLPKEGTKLWWILGAGFVAVILPATFAYARQHSE